MKFEHIHHILHSISRTKDQLDNMASFKQMISDV